MREAEREAMRVAAVDSYRLVGADRVEVLDGVTQVAASLFDAPMASVTLIHREQLWFAGRTGLVAPGISRAVSFSDRLVGDPQPLVVTDTRDDPLFRFSPHVTQAPSIRFYAGVPLVDGDGHVLGAVAVLDREPRLVGSAQMGMLQSLAGQATAHLQAIRDAHLMRALEAELTRRWEQEADAIASVSHELRTPVAAMQGFVEMLLEQPELAAYRGLLEPIKREGTRMTAIAERIVAAASTGRTERT